MKYLVLFISLLLVGCQKPEVYLYSKYISQQEVQHLSQEFEDAGYKVEVNSLPFPQGISDTSILFSPMLKDRKNVDKAVGVLNDQGLEVNSISSLVEGSHFVTKNALAVFIVSDLDVFESPLQSGQTFASKNCDTEYEIHITANHSAEVTQSGKKVGVSWQLLANQEIFQLTKSNGNGPNYNYDIYKSVSRTPVGVVDEITLKPILWNTWFGDCEFYYGLVRTAP